MKQQKDILDQLNEKQLEELDKAIEEVSNGELISWDDFKKEIEQWKNNYAKDK